MKYKKLTKSQIVISIDRLTRFKPTEEKYLRVFKDILVSALISPKYKKAELDKISYKDLTLMASEIFNNSLSDEFNCDNSINQILLNEENKIFNNNEDVQYLLKNNLNYASALNLVDDNTEVLNLKYLKKIVENYPLNMIREKFSTLFPLCKILLVEGITEEILLPKVAELCGYDFNKNGIKVVAAGGKNQVVKTYYKMVRDLKLPIFVLLDSDANENKLSIEKKLRNIDKVHLLNSGEFEDLLPKSLILRTINSEFKNFVKLTLSDLSDDLPTVKLLENIYKDKCLHEFKKAEFAERIKSQMKSEKDLSDEVKEVIQELQTL